MFGGDWPRATSNGVFHQKKTEIIIVMREHLFYTLEDRNGMAGWVHSEDYYARKKRS
jgi:hypothetical protein